MKKEQVTIFNLEDAFKALDELEIPKAERGIKANKTDLVESFKDFNRSRTDLLMEEYYDIADSADLEEAKAEREAEVAKAKLARIEKIVDLEAESEEDLLPSYVGKMIIQCPQCMTLFYKDETDIVKSETDEETVNVAEACQHCGNDAGYTLIGKVEGIKEEELIPEENVEEIPAEEENIDLEPVEEVEETSEEGEEDLDLAPVEDSEVSEEKEVEEEIKESLQLNEDFEADKDTLKDAINNAFENGDSKTEIINVIIDNIEEKDIEEIFNLLEKHLGNINLNQEQIQQIIDKLPEDCKEKAKAENWAKVKSICDFIDVTPELKNNPEAFLWVVKTVLLVAAVACPADGPVLDIIAAIIMLIPNNLIGKIWAVLAQFCPIIAAAKLGSKIAGNKIEDNVEKAILNDNIEESLNQNKSLVESSISSISDFIIYGLDKENVEIIKNKVTGSESIVKRCANKILKENPEIYYIYVSELVDGNEVPRDDLELVRSELAVDEKDYFNNEAETEGYIVYGCDENFNVIEQKQVKIREAIHKTGKEMLDANKNIIYIYVSQLIAGKEIARDDLEMVRYGYDEEELADDELLMAESLTEDIDKDLQDKLDAHNDYIKYLQEEISKEEKALEEAKNDFIKEAIQRRIDALKEDLEKALPEEVKEIKEVVTEEDAEKPLEIEDEEIVSNIEDEIQDEDKEEVEEEKVEEVEAEEEVKESLTEAKESKMKKLSGAEFDDLMDFLADQKNESFEDLDHIDEKRFAKCLGEALNRKEKTVKAVKVESCSLAPDNRLIIECKVKLLDNTTANINYICKGFINKENQKLIEGITEGYINKEFICNYTFENRTLITESIRHSK